MNREQLSQCKHAGLLEENLKVLVQVFGIECQDQKIALPAVSYYPSSGGAVHKRVVVNELA